MCEKRVAAVFFDGGYSLKNFDNYISYNGIMCNDSRNWMEE